MQALVDYSKGSGKVIPYEGQTGSSTSQFLNVPTGVLAATLSKMYPFAVTKEDDWPQLRQMKMYPLTALWPRSVLKRFMHFNDLFHLRYEQIKTAYEESGGKYHGDSDSEDDDVEEKDDEAAPAEEKTQNLDLECDKFF